MGPKKTRGIRGTSKIGRKEDQKQEAPTSGQTDEQQKSQPTPENSTTGIQTESTKSFCIDQAQMERCYQNDMELREKVIFLRKVRDSIEHDRWMIVKNDDISEERLKSCDDFVKILTGIPKYDLLMMIFKYVSRSLLFKSSPSLTHFQEFLLVMIHLKLNVSLLNLSTKFGISERVANEIFKKWIKVMYLRFNPTIEWPERKTLIDTMPSPFKNVFHDSVVVIAHCIVIHVTRPPHFEPYDNFADNIYPNCFTIIFVIGISTNGTIKFVSDGFPGGDETDREIMEQSGLLNHILPGDIVLTMFEQSEWSVLTRNGEKLEELYVENQQKLPEIFPHVEKIIDRVIDEYNIRSSILPSDMLDPENIDVPLVHKMLVTICALINLSPLEMQN